MQRLIETILDLLFPRRCPFCGEISDGICKKCRSRIPVIGHPRCYLCGRPVESEDAELCNDCRDHRHFFSRGRALYSYEKQARDAIHAVKYQNRREYLEYFAREMAENFREDLIKWKPEAVIPIPMHKKDRIKRGYNQAEILAIRFGMETGIPVCTKALCKIRRTASQKEMDSRQRRKNLKGAFGIDGKYLDRTGRLPWKKVVLMDDVYTTGSTLDEAAKTLISHGVEEVFFVTVCIVTE